MVDGSAFLQGERDLLVANRGERTTVVVAARQELACFVEPAGREHRLAARADAQVELVFFAPHTEQTRGVTRRF